jgi:acetoacetyl-CoA reductase
MAAMTRPPKAFKKETTIQVFKWDVSNYVACEQGVANVENEVGQIEVLVNNAGITRDGMLHRMTHEQCSLCIGGGMGVAMAVER